MSTNVRISLNDLQCISQGSAVNPPAPYIWPAMVLINTSNLGIAVVTPAPSQARVVLRDAIRPGDTVSIPIPVGQLNRQVDDPSTFKLVLTVVLWEKEDLSDDEIAAGFNVFAGALQDRITANLGGLASPDPADNQKAIDSIKASVHQTVSGAIQNSLSFAEEIEYEAGFFHPDAVIDNSSTTVAMNTDQSLRLTFSIGTGPRMSTYQIDGMLQLQVITCQAEQDAVNQDQVNLNQLGAELAEMKKELAQAPPPEKKAIEQDILDFGKNEIAPAKAKLTRDKQALAACRAAQTARK
jgi:hypothetical protein